ncbi:hypothetical protein PR202_gb15835 [Eleusine coracana subsp. coracana]|uniref:Uncharacterized protein n=1 Tax=Eleusine coracana subsp. coracana TaxID=191504 RepID=A0AAV5EYY2_ELECO|nr:hypothetical protein PR202_gb15835 [Eleusine coracana subsp. coracana]
MAATSRFVGGEVLDQATILCPLQLLDDATEVPEKRPSPCSSAEMLGGWAMISVGALCKQKADLGIAGSKPTQAPSWIGDDVCVSCSTHDLSPKLRNERTRQGLRAMAESGTFKCDTIALHPSPSYPPTGPTSLSSTVRATVPGTAIALTFSIWGMLLRAEIRSRHRLSSTRSPSP